MKKIDNHFSNLKKNHLDGLSIDLADVWFSLRPSQTEQKIRLLVEGKNKNKVNFYKNKLIRLIKKYDRD